MVGVIVASVLSCSAAMAAELEVSIMSAASSSITVVPCGSSVAYEVRASLSDTGNEGLAGFLFDLTFDGGPLEAGEAPVADPMVRFDRPAGITGPGGFGGLVVDVRLVGVGGAQNTIKNTADYAPFPIGEVVPGVGHTEIILITGSFSTPTEPGTYTLSLSNVSATVIKQGEDGSGIVWATEPAGAGTISNLTVIVPAADPPATASNSGPVCTGDDVTLFGGPDGMTSYLWTGPNGFASPDQNPVISPAVRGTYVLTMTDTGGCITVDRTVVDVIPASCAPWVDCNTNDVHDPCDIGLGTSDDCNWNMVPDECDLAGATSLDCNVTAVPDECEWINAGDFDADGGVDLDDYRAFADCASAPGSDPSPIVPECVDSCRRAFDSDNDRDIDLRDFAAFQLALRPR